MVDKRKTHDSVKNLFSISTHVSEDSVEIFYYDTFYFSINIFSYYFYWKKRSFNLSTSYSLAKLTVIVG